MTLDIRAALVAHAEACRLAMREMRPRPELPAETGAYLAGAYLAGANLARADLAGAYLASDVRITGWLCIGPIGSRRATLTLLRCDDGSVTVLTGCYRGTLDEFARQVEQVHAGNQHGQDYRAAIALARSRFTMAATGAKAEAHA